MGTSIGKFILFILSTIFLLCSFSNFSTHENFVQIVFFFLSAHKKLAQLDACPTGVQEVAGLTPTGLATFFHGD